MTTTPLSERLQRAKSELGLSTRRAVEEAAKGGYETSVYTVTQCLNGKHGKVTDATVRALAHAFRIPVEELSELAGLPERHERFRLEGRTADYAASLTRAQSEAVKEIMRLFAESNRREEEGISDAERDMPPTDSRQQDYGLAAYEGDEGVRPDQDLSSEP